MKHLVFTAIFTVIFTLSAVTLDFSDSGKRLPSVYGFKARGTETKLTEAGVENRSLALDKASGFAASKRHADFSPDGAFEFEVRFKLFPELLKKRTGGRFFLWDNKYSLSTDDPKASKHCGFMVWLERKGKNFTARVLLGLNGKASAGISAEKLNAGDGRFHTLRLKFDPSGWQTLYWDGIEKNRVRTPAGKIGKAQVSAVIGNRSGSIFGPLDGVVESIVIRPVTSLNLSGAGFIQRKYGSRRVFVRREANSVMTAKFSNMTDKPLSGTMQYTIRGLNISGKIPISAKPSGTGNAVFPVETNLMPGKYQVDLAFTAQDGKKIGKGTVEYGIVPEFTDGQFILSGDYYSDGKSLDLVRNAGITHIHGVISAQKGKLSDLQKANVIERLDLYLEHGLRCDDRTRITNAFVKDGKYLLVDRNGKPYARKSVDAAEKAVHDYAVSALVELAQFAGKHPAWDHVYTNNELRDAAQVTFTENTRKRLKEALNMDIPKNASGRLPDVYTANPNVPWDCVVSEKSDEFRFWNWYWREGDGWDRLNGDQGFYTEKTAGRKEFLSDFGPATRALPYLGIAGRVSMVSTWTYSNPDPVKLGQTTDELLALADGKRLAGIGNQGIWYRNQVAPPNKKVENPPAWLAQYPEAKYISPHPDALLEGFWIASMRKMDRFDIHGQGAWLRPTNHSSYRFTNARTREAVKTFQTTLRDPLGPALKYVDEVTPEVMILESFSNALYGGGHPWGWGNGWPADLHLALQWGHIQAGICYEDHLFRGNLDDGKVKVLFVPSLPVVSERLLAKLQDLQSKGVILAGDEKLNIALMPDLRFQSVVRDPANAEKSKKALQKLGAELRKSLKNVLTPCMDSSSQDLILRRRASGEVHYLFAVNDCRKYGNYVGQWKRVMEEGIPLSASFTAALPAGAAYELVSHKPVEFKVKGRKVEFNVNLDRGSGNIIALFPRAIGMVKIEAPAKLKRGENFTFKAFVADKFGKKFKAVLPLEVRFETGKTVLPGTGFYATDRKGNFTLSDTAALNMPAGKAVLRIKCLASGIEAVQEISVQ